MNGSIISSSKDKTLPQLFVVEEVIFENLVQFQLYVVALFSEFCNILKQIILFEFISV